MAGMSLGMSPAPLLRGLTLALAARPALGGRPADSPCITWVMDDKGANINHFSPITDWLPATIWAWQWAAKPGKPGVPTGGSCAPCNLTRGLHDFDCGYVFPCFADGPDMWGHRDLMLANGDCKFQYENGTATTTVKEWTPKKGAQWEHFGWQVSQKGSVPDKGEGQLIVDPSGQFVLARSPAASPFVGCLPGGTGWVKLQADGTLGCMEYAANINPVEMCNGFEVAYCKTCKPCPTPYNSTFDPGKGCPACKKPPAPPPPPPPPLPPPPPTGTPCIRFGNAVPSDNIIDATITQGSVTHSWSNYRFGQFSDWVSVFVGGSGTITLKDHTTGAVLLSTKIPLTPGPLVVVVKDTWPPKVAKNVETIAASFVPPKSGSAVRLFNLASDVPTAGLADSSGKKLADGVKYTLGSVWAPVDGGSQTFTAVADSSPWNNASAAAASVSASGGGELATMTTTPPAAPNVFTAFLMGDAKYKYTLLPQVDAPETGPCKPSS